MYQCFIVRANGAFGKALAKSAYKLMTLMGLECSRNASGAVEGEYNVTQTRMGAHSRPGRGHRRLRLLSDHLECAFVGANILLYAAFYGVVALGYCLAVYASNSPRK